MTVTRKVLALLGTSLLCMAVLLAIAVVALDRVADAKDQVIDRESRVVADAHRLDAAVGERSVAVRNFLITNDPRYLSDIEQEGSRITSAIEDLDVRVYTDDGRRLLEETRTWLSTLVATTAEVVADLGDGSLTEPVPDLLRDGIIPARQAVKAALDNFIAHEEELIEQAVASSDRTVARTVALLLALGALVIVATLVVGARIVQGLTRSLTQVALSIDAAAAEILAGTAQQVAGASQQAAAVQETVSTTDELAQTAGQSAQWARTVADRAQQAAEVAEGGTRVVGDAVVAMNEIRAQVDSIADTVVSLAERAQDISGIVQSVDDIAEQVHLLGLNAAIEAARAGEQGRGFSVVASEVRALADQSRRATVKISEILGEVQQRTNTAVIATEEGGKSVAKGVEQIEGTGSTIDELADMVASAVIAAEQISASSGQQAVATSQISEAMRDLDDVTQQGTAAARQVEQSARDLNAVAADLKALVGAG